MKRFLFALFCMLNIDFTHAATEMTDVYLLAQTKNATELQNIKNIDIVDKNGDTALCSAIKDGNVDAYNLLRNAGANADHKCVKKIPTEQYEHFITRVASANKSWSFLGLGKLAWTAIGVGVAGGAVAAGMGGGGSGGGDSSNTNSVDTDSNNNNHNSNDNTENNDNDDPVNNDYQQNQSCESQGYIYEYSSQCPTGYTLGTSCISGNIKKYKCDKLTTCLYNTTECSNGYVETGNICISGGDTYKECMPASCNGYDYTNSSQCPSGYTVGSSCLSGTTMKYKCDVAASCPGYEYTDSAQCPDGWTTGTSCISGSVTKYKCDVATTCPYNSISCDTGFHETGQTCKSGNTTYVQCEPDTCEGFNYTTCPQGWDPSESCKSGNTTKYKCDIQHQCQMSSKTFVDSCPQGWILDSTVTSDVRNCYSGNTHYVRCTRSDCSKGKDAVFISCDEGWHQVSNPTHLSCTQYGVTYDVRCEPNDCSDYNHTSSVGCPIGWEIGSSCKSGDTSTIMYKCDKPATCSYTTTSCTGGYKTTGNTCVSGDTVYRECEQIQCGENATWTQSGCVCNYGYGNWTEGYGCYKNIACGSHATQNGTQCQCDPGYENWTEGTGCTLKELNCGANAHQTGTQCQCDFGYENWTEGIGCSLNCGYHAIKNGEQCQCDTGYDNWTLGQGCSLKGLNCGANAHQTGTQCQCDPGYENWTEGTGCTLKELNCGANAHQTGTQCQCNTGYINWTNGYGCYQQLECGIHAYQNGENCECEPGYNNWENSVGCSVYGENDTSNPKNSFIYDNQNRETVGYSITKESGNYFFTTNTDKGLYITKTSDGDVFGIKGSYGWVYIYSYGNGIKTNISINKTGTGNIHAVKSQSGIYFGDSGSNNMNNFIINNNGQGDIYGLEYGNNQGNVSLSSNTNDLNTINIFSINNDGNIYGLYSIGNSSTSETRNAIKGQGVIKIDNFGDGDIYGMYAPNGVTNYNAVAEGTGKIQITNTGNGDVFGINGRFDVYNISSSNEASYSNLTSTTNYDSHGHIDICNHGDGNVFGIKTDYDAINSNTRVTLTGLPKAYGTIKIDYDGSGNAYGMYSNLACSGSNCKLINALGGTGEISIQNRNNGNIYGMYGAGYSGMIINAAENKFTYKPNSYTTNNYTNFSLGYINLVNLSSGNAYGIYGKNVFNENSDTDSGSLISIIGLQNLSTGNATGIYTANGTVNNSGEININNTDSGTVFGIFGDTNSTINNSGVINITRESYVDEDNVLHTPSGTAGDVFGIYAKSGSIVDNSGNINITTNGNAYGIYVESGSTVTNTGTISLNGVACGGNDCNTGNYIVLNGSVLYNSGAIKANTLNLAPMKGKVVAGADSSFVIDDDLSGDLYISSDIVTSGNQTTYIAKNMIDAGDTSGLNLISDSAMFDAALSGKDVVLQMKDFDSLTDNKSLAAFLKNNYDAGNGGELFATLKSMDNISAFNGALSGFTGLNTFTQFAHEDLSAMREISLSMNNKLFENSDREKFDISDSMGYFSFSNNHNSGSGQYGISSSKLSENWKLGYGIAMANIYTNDGDGFSRQNQMWMFYMPVTYTNDDIELVINSHAGFTHGRYNRRGFNNQNYEGYIEKQIVGLMNDLRYPVTFGNWTFAPDLAFNTIVYTQDGQEDGNEYALVIPHDNTVSVETGLGLYTKYEKTFQNGSRLNFSTGIMGYREFGDTYNIKLGMRGMDGTFDLYNNDYKYRGALNVGLDYTTGRLHLYGNTQYFMDNANYMNFKGGVSYRF